MNTVEEVLEAAIDASQEAGALNRVRQIVKHLGRECRRIMRGTPFTTFADVLGLAYQNIAKKVASDPEKRAELDKEFQVVAAALADFPLAKTAPFFDVPESQEKDTGGLLSVTLNPETCKGCNVCVDVCPSGALVTVKQTDGMVADLRRRWDLWHHLPETDDRYVDIASLEEEIGVLSSLLLKQDHYMSMVGGDGACMGCGEKTGIHLITSAVHAVVLPRVKKLVAHIDEMVETLDAKARELVSSDADLEAIAASDDGKAKQSAGHEYYATLRTQAALERAEVAIVLIDASEPLSEQDVRILAMAVEAGRALVIAFNKWDLVDEDRRRYLDREIDRDLNMVAWAPRVNVSALTGRHMDKLTSALEESLEGWETRVSTGRLNKFFADLTAAHPHPVRGGKQPRILFGTQVGVGPPSFALFTTGFLEAGYRRFIERRLREEFGFTGSPIRIMMRVREKRRR